MLLCGIITLPEAELYKRIVSERINYGHRFDSEDHHSSFMEHVGKTGLTETLSVPTLENEFSYFRTSGCFQGLEYRIKRGAFNKEIMQYVYTIEFQNNYDEAIWFSYSIGREGSQPQQKGDFIKSRVTVKSHARNISTFTLTGIESALEMHIHLARVDYDGGNFIRCGY